MILNEMTLKNDALEIEINKRIQECTELVACKDR